MKTEILFKAKRVDNGEWVFGYLIKKQLHNKFDSPPSLMYEKWFIDKGSDINLFDGIFQQVEVHPETVCQFTGSLDKNGNKIFNGDISESSYYNTPLAFSKEKPSYTYLKQVVEFSVGCFILRNMEEHDDWEKSIRNKTELHYIKSTLTIKVIGNIHD